MKGCFLIAALILSVIFAYLPAQGAVYYVAKGGKYNNPGTEVKPWKTIGKASKTLVAGDTVYIKEGTIPFIRMA